MILGILLIVLGYGSWEQTGPVGGMLQAPVQSLQNSNELWAVAGSNETWIVPANNSTPVLVVHSTDAGLSWKECGSIDACITDVVDMAIGKTGNLVIVTNDKSWTSSDGGRSWTPHGITGIRIMSSIVPHPSNGNEFFAVATSEKINGFFRTLLLHSTDGGASFSSKEIKLFPSKHIFGKSIAVSRSNPSIILIGSSASTTAYTFKTTDGGNSFTNISPVSSGGYYCNSVAIHPTNSNILLASTFSNMYRSVNGGSRWTRVASQKHNFRLQFSLSDNNLIFVCGLEKPGYMHHSTNNGTNWSSAPSGLHGEHLTWVVPDWKNSSLAYTVTSHGFFKSTNSGKTWNSSNSELYLNNIINMLEVQGYIYLNTYYNGLYKTQIGSNVSWQKIDTPLDCGYLCDLATDNSGTILALEGGG